IADVARTPVELVWVDESFLLDQNVAPWTELPLWLPDEHNGMLDVDISHVLDDGLTFRPLEETVWDLLEASKAHAADAAGRLASGAATGPHLTPDRERGLLAAWRRQQVQDDA